MRKIIGYGVVTGVLLIAMIVVLVIGFGTPARRQKTVTLLDYQLSSNFSQEAYGYRTAPASTGPSVYFMKIVDSVVGSYHYEFQAPEGVTDIKTGVQVTATVASQGWSKDIVVIPRLNAANPVNLSFPIDLAAFTELNNIISEEIGMKPTSFNVTLRADVDVAATGPSGPITDSFTQTTVFTVGELTLQWDPVPVQTFRSYGEGLAYRQEGNFSYAVNLLPNSLFAADTLRSPAPAPSGELHKLAVTNNYGSSSIDQMDITLQYSLTADRAVDDLNHRVEISGVLVNPDGPQAAFTYLTPRDYHTDLNETFTIDTDLIYDMIQALEGVTDRAAIGNTYDLNITAKIHTTGEVDGKLLDKTVTNTIPVTFKANSIGWPSTTSAAESDTITGTETVASSTRTAVLTAGYALAGFTLAFLLLTVWTFLEWRKRREDLSPVWMAAQRTADKRQDVITDVTALPAPVAGGQVMTCRSLDELVKLSDALLKPILHQVSDGVHLYAVIDGTSRYEYSVSEKENKA